MCGLLVAFGSSWIRAAHIIGGEITYEDLGFTNGDPNSGSRTYRFTMRIYRDCQGSGANFDGPNGAYDCHVTIYQGTSLFQTLVLAAPTSTRLDPNPGNPCLIVPGNVCVEEGVYVFPPIDLPIINESYHVIYQRCCRNNTISNIFSPGMSGATYTIELTAAAQNAPGGNSSPRFVGYPPIVLCAGEDFIYDFSATDADGDQLVYEFCAPLLGGGLNFNDPQNTFNGLAPNPEPPPPFDPVEFRAPDYSPTFPLGQESILSFNTFTGRMSGIPALLGQFVVGICVSEYRNGVLLSTVRRDFQFNVTTCNNVVSANVREDSVAVDNTFIISECGQTRVLLFNESGLQAFIDGYRWEISMGPDSTLVSTSRDLVVDFPGPGQYRGLMIVNPDALQCIDTAVLLINVFPGIEANFDFAYDTCRAEPVQFTDRSVSGSGQVTAWNWRFGDGGVSNLAAPRRQYSSPGARNVRLLATDVNGCQDSITRLVRYFPVPPLIVISPSTFRGCPPAEIFFDNLSSPIDNNYQVNWDFGDGNTSDDISPTHTFDTDGIFSVAVEIISPIGCATDTLFTDLINIEPAPIAGFDFTPEAFTNFQPEVQLIDQSAFAYRWFWDFNGEDFSLETDPSYRFRDTGLAYITQVVTHPSGCIDSLTRIFDVKPEITLHFPNAFTPNDDSLNDVFRPTGFLRGYQSYQLRIWNRWGETTFESDDPDLGWNGRKNNSGQPAPPGVYLYELSLRGPRGEPQQYRGSVTLLR